MPAGLRALAVTMATRSPALPDIPTVGRICAGLRSQRLAGNWCAEEHTTEVIEKLMPWLSKACFVAGCMATLPVFEVRRFVVDSHVNLARPDDGRARRQRRRILVALETSRSREASNGVAEQSMRISPQTKHNPTLQILSHPRIDYQNL